MSERTLIKKTESYLRQVHWLEAHERIHEWEDRGIAHGFEGCGFELPASAISLQQVHGSLIVEASSGLEPAAGLGKRPIQLATSSQQPSRIELGPADGILSRQPQQIIAVKTADCVPILIAHPEGVMALHAGWKGLAAGILDEALRLMHRQGWRIEDAAFGIGPCISLASFEIGPELIEAFRKGAYQLRDIEFAFASSKGRGDRWHLDLGLLCVLALARLGFPPTQVSVIRSCTQQHPELWHSYRRNGAKAGRNWSWIAWDGA